MLLQLTLGGQESIPLQFDSKVSLLSYTASSAVVPSRKPLVVLWSSIQGHIDENRLLNQMAFWL